MPTRITKTAYEVSASLSNGPLRAWRPKVGCLTVIVHSRYAEDHVPHNQCSTETPQGNRGFHELDSSLRSRALRLRRAACRQRGRSRDAHCSSGTRRGSGKSRDRPAASADDHRLAAVAVSRLARDTRLVSVERSLCLALIPRHWHRERVTRRKHESLRGYGVDSGVSVVCAHVRSSHRLRQRRGYHAPLARRLPHPSMPGV